MSEPKLISPLLDGFAMGAPMSSHDGVQCCPAMKENSDNKYIVKIISVPASQKQLDALLFTGAYKDPGEATDYFKELADGIVREAVLLKKLSKLEGFVPYLGWQIVPMEGNDLGYDIYLYSEYRQSLAKYTRQNLMTHLGAVNLGLDLCAALAICRRAGRLYVDLKPTNIFISPDKEYRIGDLGFVEIGNLKYTCLPTKYCSAYSAPELKDPMNALNTTADIYSVGMILYQIYNNGKLPQSDADHPGVYPTPENADYEIAEIIMKAIAPQPEDRWQTPIEMGQALVAYLQRNTINDVPISPPTASVGGFTPLSGKEAPEPAPADTETRGNEEFDFMSGIVSDETTPGEEDAADAESDTLSEDAAAVLAQAENLIEHTVPSPLPEQEAEESAKEQAGEPTDESAEADPEEETPEPEELPEDEAPKAEEDEPEDDLDDDEEEDEDEEDDDSPASGGKKHWVGPLVTVLIIALLLGGGYFFYKNYYLIPIDELKVETFQSDATIHVTTEGDLSLLRVVCTDIYGNVQTLSLENGQASFQDLLPDTQYKIELEVEGFHSLTGSTSSSFSTPAVTTVSNFSAVTGETDGSAVLSFDTEGPGTEDWTVTYSAEGEDSKTVSFTGHTVTISDLTVGSSYHFELNPATGIYMTGENTLDFTASAIVLAENLKISDYADNTLTAQWTAPEGTTPEFWIVRCYSADGVSETMEVTDPTATFSGIDTAKSYTVEVAAKGMTQTARAHVSANPARITDFHVDESDPGKLVVTWEYEGSRPEDGWVLLYSADNLDKQISLSSDGTRVEIAPRVPGTTYHFELQSASGTSVFNGVHSHTCAQADKFNSYEMLVDYSEYYLCKTPSKEGWKYSDVKRQDYTTTFAAGDPVSMIIKTATHYIPRDNITILYAIRDGEGNLICELSKAEIVNWYQLWQADYPYTTLDIPLLPKESGTYLLCLFFNYKYVTEIEFTITE